MRDQNKRLGIKYSDVKRSCCSTMHLHLGIEDEELGFQGWGMGDQGLGMGNGGLGIRDGEWGTRDQGWGMGDQGLGVYTPSALAAALCTCIRVCVYQEFGTRNQGIEITIPRLGTRQEKLGIGGQGLNTSSALAAAICSCIKGLLTGIGVQGLDMRDEG